MRTPIKYVLLYSVFAILLSFTACKSVKDGGTAKKSKQNTAATLDEKNRHIHEIFIDANKEKMVGNTDKSQNLFENCLKLDPKNGASMYELAQIYASKEKISDALRMAGMAVETEPQNQWYLYLYGQLLEQYRKYSEAAAVFSKLTKLYPQNTDFLYDLAECYIYSGKYNDALKIYNTIEQKIGISELISFQKQKILLHLNKTDNAIDEINKLIAKYPTETKYYTLLAEIYLANKQPDKALETYRKAQKINPDDPYIHIALYDYYRKTSDKTKSFEELKTTFENQYLDIDTKIQVLLTYYTVTESNPEFKTEAFELIQILKTAHPNNAKVFSMEGDFLYRDKKLKESEEAFRNVIKLDSSKYVIWEQLLRIEAELEDYNNLISDSKTAIGLYPEQPLPYMFLGMAESQQKSYESAIKHFRQCLNLVVDNKELEATLYSFLGDNYNLVKDDKSSDEAYENSLRINPDNAYVLNNYSYYLSLRGSSMDKAEKMAKRANELIPDNSSYLDTYAWVLYKLGRFDDAEIWQLKALEKDGGKSAVILEHYGDILFKMGKAEKALEYWNKAKNAGEGSELLKRKISEKKLIE